MTPRMYDVGVVLALILTGAGSFMIGGLGPCMVVVGALCGVFTVVGAILSPR